MSELKITPGPWEVERKDGDCVYGGRAGMELVCQTYNNENDAADARLIAAAPDLLEVVQMLLEDFNRPLTSMGLRLRVETIDKARAAIAKAKGED